MPACLQSGETVVGGCRKGAPARPRGTPLLLISLRFTQANTRLPKTSGFTFHPNPGSWARSRFLAGKEPSMRNARKLERRTSLAAKHREEKLRTSPTFPMSPGLRDSQLAQGIHSPASLGGSQAKARTPAPTLASQPQQCFCSLSLRMPVTGWV